MLKNIFFATTNEGKCATLKDNLGEEFKVTMIDLDITEPQADTVEEIVTFKGDTAFQLIQKPVIVQDSGFVIPALNNFPGPYIKYILDSIGVEGLLKLMKGVTDRRCYFIGCTCYTDKDSQHIFTFKSDEGTLSEDIRGETDPKAWGGLWHVFIPSWSETSTYSEMGIDVINQQLKDSKHKTDLEQMADYLKTNQ